MGTLPPRYSFVLNPHVRERFTTSSFIAENLIRLIPHQGCVISRTVDGIDIAVEFGGGTAKRQVQAFYIVFEQG